MFEFDNYHIGTWGTPPFIQDHQDSRSHHATPNHNSDTFPTHFDTSSHMSNWDANTHSSLLNPPFISLNMNYTEQQQQPLAYSNDDEQYNSPVMPLASTTTFIPSDFTTLPENSSSSSFSSSSSPPDSTNEQAHHNRHHPYQKQRKSSDTSLRGERESSPTSNSPIKKAHSSVERAYRERLNDKIDALASLLFFDSSLRLTSKGTIKPSKCLVISRAKERIEQLDSQNFALRHSVEALKQHMAVLNHLLVVEKSGKEIGDGDSFNAFSYS